MNLINLNIYDNIEPSKIEQIQGWNSNSNVFKNVIKETRPFTIIEVGTWLGASAIHMGKIIKELGLNTKIYCIDTWLGSEEFWTSFRDDPQRNLKLKNGYPQIYFEFLSNVVKHNLQDVIIPIPNTSFISYLILKNYNISADLIYIDGSHEYIDVKNDIINYLNLLNPSGIMFGDDYNDWQGVNLAVNECLPNQFQIEENFWIFKKKNVFC